MKINLKRTFKNNNYTIGKLYINDIYQCDTIEDTDRGLVNSMPLEVVNLKKVYGKTCIPKGTYKINMDTISPKFKDRTWAKPYDGKLPRLENVVGFDGVLIHVGNNEEDTLGCILVGENKVKGKVINSTIAFNKIMKVLLNAYKSGEGITITIE